MAVIVMEQEKERLTDVLAAQYAHGLVAIDEYERLLDFINKTETNKEIEYIRKIITTNETYTLKEQPAMPPKAGVLARLIHSLFKKENTKKIRIYSGVYELRLYDMDFIENRLVVKIKNFGGDAFVYIAKNTVVENNLQIYGGKCIVNERINAGDIANKLVLNGANYGGNVYIVYE
jgi:hypothetical protein